MKKFLKERMKKSDKGFSLVELIVVIAIMAVLIGVIAPAFMKYVGKSKTSVMEQNKEELQRAANVVLIDDTFTAPTAEMKITITKGAPTVTGGSGNFQTLLEAAMGGSTKYPNDEYKYTITIAAGGTSATVTATK